MMLVLDLVEHLPIGNRTLIFRLVNLSGLIHKAASPVPREQASVGVGYLFDAGIA